MTKVGIVVTLRNPRFSFITGNFGIAVMRKLTQIMYDRKLDILGVTITPGRITGVKLTRTDTALTITRNKIMQFQLKFKPSNFLKDGSMIVLGFPASIKVYSEKILGQDVMFWVEFGLEDKSEDDPLKMTFDSVNDIMKITNYKPKVVADEIIVKFWATTPDNVGESSPINIITYTNTNSTFIIDRDTQFAKTIVTDVST